MPKNVTPNCLMLDLILMYFKSVYLFIDNLEEMISIEHSGGNSSANRDIDDLIDNKVSGSDGSSLIKQLFSLKQINECEIEANL